MPNTTIIARKAAATLTVVGLSAIFALAGAGCGSVETGASDSAMAATIGSGGNPASVIKEYKPMAEKCNGPVNSYISFDGSASGQGSDKLSEQRLGATASFMGETVACGGTINITSFSNSVTNVVQLGSAELPSEFGQAAARVLHNAKLANKLLAAVATAEAKLEPVGGTDVVHQFKLAREFADESPDGKLNVLIATDGLDNVGYPELSSSSLDEPKAEDLASSLPVPAFVNAAITIEGIGVTADDKKHPPTPEHVFALKRFYQLACEKTGAKCSVQITYSRGA